MTIIMADSTQEELKREKGPDVIIHTPGNEEILIKGLILYEAVGHLILSIIPLLLFGWVYDFYVYIAITLLMGWVFWATTKVVEPNKSGIPMLLAARRFDWGEEAIAREGYVPAIPSLKSWKGKGDDTSKDTGILDWFIYYSGVWKVNMPPGAGPNNRDFEVVLGDYTIEVGGDKNQNSIFSVKAKLSFQMQVSDPKIALSGAWDRLESGITEVAALELRHRAITLKSPDGTVIPKPGDIMNAQKELEREVWNFLVTNTEIIRKQEQLGVHILGPLTLSSLRVDEKIENAQERIRIVEADSEAANQRSEQFGIRAANLAQKLDIKNPLAALFVAVMDYVNIPKNGKIEKEGK